MRYEFLFVYLIFNKETLELVSIWRNLNDAKYEASHLNFPTEISQSVVWDCA